MKMKKIKRFISVLMLVSVFFFSFSIATYGEKGEIQAVGMPSLDCRSAILIEANTGAVLYEKNADEALPPASVTKIM